LPVIFLVENNVYAISVRQDKQMAVDSVADKAAGLGLPGISVDGLDLHACFSAVSQAAERARAGQGPTLVEVRVHRMTPHSSDDDDRSYRTKDEMEAMKREDPLGRFQQGLIQEGLLEGDRLEELEAQAKEAVEDAVKYAEAADYPQVEEAGYPVYAEDVRSG
jgi:2-oxoisovalerate dehydrogenase E1 component alpha subunit